MTEPLYSLSISRWRRSLPGARCRRMEVTEAVLARIKARDGELNTYISVDEAGARAMAQEAARHVGPG